MADARVARQKALEDREPVNPISVSQDDIEQRILSRAMPRLDAAIAKSRAAQADLPPLVPQEDIPPSPSKRKRSIAFWGGVVGLSLLLLGLFVFAALAYSGTGLGGELHKLVIPGQ